MAQGNISPAVTLDRHILDKFQKALQGILICVSKLWQVENSPHCIPPSEILIAR